MALTPPPPDYGDFVTPVYKDFVKYNDITYSLPTLNGGSVSYIAQSERTFVYNNKLYIFSSRSQSACIIDIESGDHVYTLPRAYSNTNNSSIGIIRYGAKAYVYNEYGSGNFANGTSQQNQFYCLDLTNDNISQLNPVPIETIHGISNVYTNMTYNMFLDTIYNKIYLICNGYHYNNMGYKDSYGIYCYDIASNNWVRLYTKTDDTTNTNVYNFRTSQGYVFDADSTTIKCHSNLYGDNYGYEISRGTNPYCKTSYGVSTFLTQDFNNYNNTNSYSNIIGMNDNRMAVHGNKLFRYSLFKNSVLPDENILGPVPAGAVNSAAYAGGVSFWNSKFWYYDSKTLYSLDYTT